MSCIAFLKLIILKLTIHCHIRVCIKLYKISIIVIQYRRSCHQVQVAMLHDV